MRTRLPLPLCILVPLISGCAAPPPARFSITPEQYDAAFAAARDVLRDRHFDLARVDARAGVITTQPSSSAGLATPWIDHTDTLEDAATGLMERERRRVEVRFLPTGSAASAAPAEASSPDADLRSLPGPYDVDVRVVVERIYQPGRRVDATGVRLTSLAQDPELIAKGEQPRYAVENREDTRLAGRLAKSIEQHILRMHSTTPSLSD